MISGSRNASMNNMQINLHPYKILLTALLTGCFFIVACENDEKKIDALLKRKTGIEEALKIQTLYSQNGKLKAKLNSSSGTRNFHKSD